VDLSLWPTLRQPWLSVREAAVFADGHGWHRVYVADHFMGDGATDPAATSTFEATAALTTLAACTEEIGLGTLVLGNTYRHPAVVANWAATVDQLSDGRLVLGLGAGWQQNEHDQYGIALPPAGERLRRFAEACEVINGLLRRPITTYVGEHYQLRDAVCEPKPIQTRLPLLIGGRRDRMLRIVARYADEWNLWADAAQFRERRQELARACDDVGRDPSSIRSSVQALVRLTGDAHRVREFVDAHAPRAAVAGMADRIVDFLGELVEAGVDEFVLPDQFLGRGEERLEALAQIEAAAGAVGWRPRPISDP
jgi:alkanesulfonate monooxygenase SsuD/methylene tetrahydromethanopterin reductase-like flavin-dependent oxidoreductase (luciferase family)